MVLFHEKKPEPSKMRRRVRLFLWIAMAVVFLGGLSILLMVALAGAKEPLKKGLEDYLSAVTGTVASIGSLDYIEFFPNIKVDLAHLTFTPAGGKEPAATIESAGFARHFWDQFFSRPLIEKLYVRNAHINAGLFSADTIDIDYLGLDDAGYNGLPALVLHGRYGGKPAEAWLAMEKQDGQFTRGDQSPFSVSLPFLKLDGVISPADDKEQIDFSSIGTPEKILAGRAFLSRRGETWHVEADLTGENSRFVFDLERSGPQISGTASLPLLDAADLTVIMENLAGAYNAWAPPSAEKTPMIAPEMVMTLGVTAGTVSFPLRVEKGVLTAGPMTGTFHGGAVDGNITLNAAANPAKLEIKGGVKQLDLQQLQKDVFGQEDAHGKADIKISLSGEPKTFADVLPSLTGEAVLIAGEGTFDNRMINLWGAGLLNAMLPSFNPEDDMKLNCLIGDFTVANGIAKPGTLFMDTAKVTIVGEGTIDLKNNRIDLLLKPMSKDPALFKTDAAAHMTGPIGHPVIEPDTLSLGETLGKLFLGTINPAFMAFSMTDLGLNENHPCRKFIEKKAE